MNNTTDTTTEDRYDTRPEGVTGHHSDEHYAEAAAISQARRKAHAAEIIGCDDCGEQFPRSDMHNAGGDWFCTPCGFGTDI